MPSRDEIMESRRRFQRSAARASTRNHLVQEEPAGLMRDVGVRMLNCSAGGCLLEMSEPLPVGAVAELMVPFGDHRFKELVEVTRCEAIQGSAVYHVGARFLAAAPPSRGSLRYALRCERHELKALLGA
jgi:hypothetical protein